VAQRCRTSIGRGVIWVVTAGQVLLAVPMPARAATAPPTPETIVTPSPEPPQVTVNRTVPAVTAPPSEPEFSATPTVAEIVRARIFGEPLVPMGEPSADENRALAQALLTFHRGGGTDWRPTIGAFLLRYPESAWRASLLANLGVLHNRGHAHTKALEAWYEAWGLARHATDAHGRAVADFAIAEWLLLSASFGHIDGVNRVLKEIDGRDIAGTAGVKIQRARETLGLVLRVRETAVPCAAEALLTLFETMGRSAPAAVSAYRSSAKGTSLAQLRDLSAHAGLPLRVVEPMRIGEIPVPSIVHLKVGHYATITAREGDAYRVEDRGRSVSYWIHRDTLFGESSGYFLVRAEEVLGTNWRVVDADTAATIRGWSVDCPPGSPPPSPPDCDPSDDMAEDEDDDPCGGAGGGFGMPVYSFQAVTASLLLRDMPLRYRVPRGPSVPLRVSYHHREALQPQIFTSANVGPKWTFEWLRFVQEVPAGALGTMAAHTWVYQPPGGREVYTTPDANGVYPAHWASRAVLVRVSASPLRYERRLPDGAVEVYGLSDAAPAGQQRAYLTELIDRFGQRVAFTWDAQFRLVAISDAIGQVTTLAYEHAGDPLKITKVTDPFGRFATFAYNQAGQLAAITDVVGLTSRFAYGANDFVTTLTTPYGVTSFRHEPNDATTLSFRYVEATDPLGGTEHLEFQWHTPSLAATLPGGDVPTGFEAWNDNLDHYNTFYWTKRAWALGKNDLAKAEITHWLTKADFYGDSEWASRPHSIKPPLEGRVWYAYTGQTPETARSLGWWRGPTRIGRVLDDGTSQIREITYNAHGRVLTDRDPLGRETTYTYDTDGITPTEVRQTGNGANDVVATFSNFTALRQPQTVIDAAGQTTTVSYNSAGQVLTVTNAKQETTTFEYTPQGYLTSITRPSAGAVTAITYDGYGRARTVTGSDGYVVTLDYDGLNRTTRVTYPDASYEEVAYDRLDVGSVRDRAGRLTRHYYDPLRRRTATRDALGRVVSQAWSVLGGLDAIIDANGNRTQWERDVQGRVTREVRADGVTATLYTYEPKSGKLATVTDPKQQVTTYTYAGDNALRSMVYTNATIATPSVSFTYDATYGRLATMTDGLGQTTYAYHPAGQLGAGQVASVDGPLAIDTVTYSYDELGRVGTRTLGTATSGWVYDALGRVSAQTDAFGTFTFAYDGATARLSSLTYPNGQTSTYTYLPNTQDRRVQEIHHRTPLGTTLSRFAYAYDVVGNILTWTQQYEASSRAYDFTYDDADQVTGATYRTTDPVPATLRRYGYGYDPAGNRASAQVDDQPRQWSYDTLNRVTAQSGGGALRVSGTIAEPGTASVQGQPVTVDGTGRFATTVPAVAGTNRLTVTATDASGNTSTAAYDVDVNSASDTFQHDANGNLIAQGTRTFEWNARNELVRVLDGGGEVARFAYDGFGRRVEKAVAAATYRFIYDGLDILEQRANASVLRHIHGPAVDQILASVGSDTVTFYLVDHLGSVVQTTNANAQVTLTRQYDPFGQTLDGGAESGYAFTGREWDRETGLYHYRARYYDAALGRFISEDPKGLAAGWNLLRYADGNPVVLSDPFGLDTYRMNRRLAGNTASSPSNPLTHSFIFTTNPDGSLQDTYSWGNKANTDGWNKNQPEDRKAAEEGLKNDAAWRVGDEGLDPFVEEAFNELNNPKNEHQNGWITFNCKTEATKLVDLANQKRKNSKR
jgi:RHS repeat-associated protein